MSARRLLIMACAAMSMAAAATINPARLRCEYMTDPIGIDEPMPRLSWIVESKQRDQHQSAYRILVASTPDLLAKGQGDLWDSGKVDSSDTVHIEYAGKPLKSGQRASWSVIVWDATGAASKPSKPALFEMGLLSPSDWKAYWIGLMLPHALEPERSGQNWIWYPEGDPAKNAPEGDRWFKGRFGFSDGHMPTNGVIGIAVDDSFSAELNGVPIGSGSGWASFTKLDVGKLLKSGWNELVVKARNSGSRAGLLVVGRFSDDKGIGSAMAFGGFTETSKDGKTWVKAKVVGEIDKEPFGPTKWGTPVQPSPHLRKDLDITKPIKRARAYATAKGLYKLFVDGAQVGKGVFTPGWTDYKKRIQYQTYDITSLLGPGKHALGMILGDGWYSGHVAWAGREQYGPKPMGLLQVEIEYADGTTDRIVTDATWQASPGPILSSDLVMGEDYDARLAFGARASARTRGAGFSPQIWSTAGFEPAGWQPPDVEELGNANLVAQRSPTVEVLEEIKPRSMKEPKPGVFVFDLGQNMVGWARLKVKGKAGDKVTIRFAEMLNPDGTTYTTNLRKARATDTYIFSGKGEEIYEPSFTFHGFRYVELTGYPGKPTLASVTGIVAGSAVEKTGEFECSNAMVNQLQHNIFWGQRGNYLEVPTDCPQRDERLGWMGDAQIFIRTACFNNDVAAFMTKWTQDVVDAQTAEGAFSDVSPKILVTNDGTPAWGDAGVIVPWTIYLCYGDTRLLGRRYDSMKAWIDYIDKANPDHIWNNRRGNDYGDWVNIGADMPRDALATAYFAYSADIVSRAASVLGKSEDAAKYAALFGSIVAAYDKAFVNPETAEIKGDTQTCYLLALRFGLLPEALREKAKQRLIDDIMVKRAGHLSTGFVGVGYLCPTLTQIGATDIAYKMLLNDTFPSWGYSIKHGATTIWERWDGWTEEKGFQDPGMNSFNHYAFGSIGEWMYQVVGGIDIDPLSTSRMIVPLSGEGAGGGERPANTPSPGYARILIRPRPGVGLTWARAAYDSIRGRIETHWTLTERPTPNAQRPTGFTLKCTVPANTTALVYIPAKDAASVREGAFPASTAPGVRFLRMEDGCAVFEVGSGSYEFKTGK